MKLIKAYIRPGLLEEVYTALRKNGHSSMTVFKGEGTGRFSDPESQSWISGFSGHAYPGCKN